MKRREFLVTSLAGALAAPVACAVNAPCPPSKVSAAGGSSSSTSCGSAPTPQVILTSPLTQSLAPFTVGQVFKKGDVPTGSYVGASITAFQADVKNLWSDGSVKFAVLSGLVATTANKPVTIQLHATTSAPASGAPPALATLKSVVTNGSIAFSGGVTGTVDLPTVIATVAPFRSDYNSGPQMSEWHWRVPVGADPFVEVWLFVRLYAGGQVEIEMCVENGHIRIANPATKSYTVTVVYNGTQRYNAALSHYANSRWSRVDWYGTDPQITPAQNTQYLKATLLVPNYFWTGIGSAALNALTQVYTPLSLPNLPVAMGDTGAQTYIGLLPQGDAMYVTSNGDARAYNAVMAMARGIGTYQMHFRDEHTNLPLLFASYPHLCVNQNTNNLGANASSSTGDFTPATMGAMGPGKWDFPHHPAPGYLAYLLSGRRIFVDQLQFATTAHFLSIGDGARRTSACIFDSTYAGSVRGASWNLRTLAMTAAMTPDAEPLRAQFQAAWAANMNFYTSKYVTGTTYGGQFVNPFGLVMMYQTNGPTVSEYNSGSGHLWAAAWMQAFFGAVQGYSWDMEPTTDSASRGQHLQLRNFVYQHAVGLAGDDTGFNYRRGGPYAMVYTLTENSNPISWCTSWSQIKTIYEAAVGGQDPRAALSTISGTGTLKQHDSDGDITGGDSSSPPEGFWANMLPALSYAVHHGAPGAVAGLARIQASPSWTYSRNYNDDPIWGILPP